MELADIFSCFPKLTDLQKERLSALPEIYAEWNAVVNLISRKDFEHFAERHLLHSMSLAFYLKLRPGHRVMDIGTGGGFPGIPLAVMYPEVSFLLVDSIGKKIKVVNAVVETLGLTNVKAIHGRAEEVKGKYDVAVTRAVAPLSSLVDWCTRPKLKINGLYCLKGGDLREEVEEIDAYPSSVYRLSDKLESEFFETKKVVYVKLR